jgi:hypothetical protein
MAYDTGVDHAAAAKRGFLLGAALFAVGAVGGLAGPALVGGLPAWERTLLFDAEVLGVVLALFSPLVFGVVLPLVE